MKPIIKEILDAEEKVDGTVRQAREQAAETVRSAEREIATRLSDTRQKAREIIQIAVEDAERQARQVRLEKLKEADRQREDLLHGNASTVDDLVGRICRIVLTTEREADVTPWPAH